MQDHLGAALEGDGVNVLGKIQSIVAAYNNQVQAESLPRIAPSDLLLQPSQRDRENPPTDTIHQLIGLTLMHRQQRQTQVWTGQPPKFKIGDRVRIDERRMGKGAFRKISDRKFSEQVYVVTVVHSASPLAAYTLSAELTNGQSMALPGVFDESSISLA